MENAKAVSEVEGKEIAEVSDEELAELIAQNSKLQENENEGDGVKADYLLLAKSGTKALKPKEKDLYIEGLKIGDIFLQKEKLILGSEIKVVPLAFITLYDEKDGTSKDARFFGRWNKEQATTFPTVEGNSFNRKLPNGHILIPVNWVMVEVLGHKEIENAVIAFKSTGSRIWRAWKKDASERSSSSATLVYKVSEQDCNNDNYEWTDFGFEFVGSLLEGETENKNEAVFCLKKSSAIRESYEKHTLIANRKVEATPVQAYIEEASDVEEASDDDMDSAGF